MTPATIDSPTAEMVKSASSTAAEDYFEAKKVVDALAKKAAPSKKIMDASIATLASTHPVADTHDASLHRITVYGNATATFLHREASSTKWEKVANGMLPFLNPEQVAIFERLTKTHKGSRITKTLKK